MPYGFEKTGFYTRDELMIIAAAREIEDGDVCVVGQGLPILAAGLAKALYSPHIVLCTEAGMIGFNPYVAPQHIADPCCTKGFTASADLIDMFTRFTGRGDIDVTFLGCAQMDKYGNVNTTVTGDYYGELKIRFPGAGGNTDFLAYSKKTILTMRGGEFVEKLDYFTSPGYLTGGKSRYELLPEGTGPHMLITTSGVFKFDKETKEIYLAEYFPGVTIEEIKKEVPWDLKIAPDVHQTKGPVEEEVAWIRNFDPVSAAGRTNALGLIARSMGERKKTLQARRAIRDAANVKKPSFLDNIPDPNKPATPKPASAAPNAPKPVTPSPASKPAESKPVNPPNEDKKPE
jgi:glutaconate CoA-transferase subunit B